MDIINNNQTLPSVKLTKEGLKEAFWKRGGVFEKFCDISYSKIVGTYYVGSEIDRFLEGIIDEQQKVLMIKEEEINQLKRKLEKYQYTEIKFA